jgi:hypothetical protein
MIPLTDEALNDRAFKLIYNVYIDKKDSTATFSDLSLWNLFYDDFMTIKALLKFRALQLVLQLIIVEDRKCMY